MVNYQNGKIYKIVSSLTDMIYIGSTTKKYLCDRMYYHRVGLKYWMSGKRGFVASFPILLYEDARIILIENHPCNSKDELRAREQHYIDLYCDTVVNLQKAYTGIDCSDMKEYNKQYYIDNQEYYKQYNKQYQKDNHKNYKQYQKQYRENNNKKINQKFVCDCGNKYTYRNKARHERTQQHQNYVNNQ